MGYCQTGRYNSYAGKNRSMYALMRSSLHSRLALRAHLLLGLDAPAYRVVNILRAELHEGVEKSVPFCVVRQLAIHLDQMLVLNFIFAQQG